MFWLIDPFGVSRSRSASAAASARMRVSSMRSAGSIWVRRDSAAATGSSARTDRVRGLASTSARRLRVSRVSRPNSAGGARGVGGRGGGGLAAGGGAVLVAKASPTGDWDSRHLIAVSALAAKRYMSSLTVAGWQLGSTRLSVRSAAGLSAERGRSAAARVSWGLSTSAGGSVSGSASAGSGRLRPSTRWVPAWAATATTSCACC
jgi:hypothetical protein